jgi:hypothetical protein
LPWLQADLITTEIKTTQTQAINLQEDASAVDHIGFQNVITLRQA